MAIIQAFWLVDGKERNDGAKACAESFDANARGAADSMQTPAERTFHLRFRAGLPKRSIENPVVRNDDAAAWGERFSPTQIVQPANGLGIGTELAGD